MRKRNLPDSVAGPPEKPERPDDVAREVWRVRLIAVLLACLAGGVALVAVDRLLGLCLFPRELTLRLRAAAEAVMPDRQDEAQPEFVEAVGPGGLRVPVPTTLSFDHAEAIRLVLELELMRTRCEEAIARARSVEYLGDDPDKQAAAVKEAADLWQAAAGRVGSFLAAPEPERARIVLAGLGWPWLGDSADPLRTEDLEGPFPERPAALGSLSDEQWKALLAGADTQEPWPQVEARLAQDYRLSEGQVRALQAYLCRRDVRRAFRSPGHKRKAGLTLARLGALTPAQVRTVLAMRGAIELLEAGTFAFPPLIEMLEARPELARPLLHECIRRNGVREQALRAANRLGGPDSTRSERTLIALGPFGAEAIRALAARRGGQFSPQAQRILIEIEADWPGGGNALELLGTDAALWRRWYRRARKAL